MRIVLNAHFNQHKEMDSFWGVLNMNKHREMHTDIGIKCDQHREKDSDLNTKFGQLREIMDLGTKYDP